MLKIISHTPKAQNTQSETIPKIEEKRTHFDPSNLRILLTCQSGLESLVRRECEKVGLSNILGKDRLLIGNGTLKNMYELLTWSRFANRVYLSLAEEKITDFDTLHEVLRLIPWETYLTGKERIIIEAASTRSILAHTPTIQSISQNAIFSTLHTPDLTNGVEVHILILLIDDMAHVLIDVTGDPLHKRGYRREAGEAPIKENLAAALLAFSNWRFKSPLIDPCTGSGTIPIEAALMARNIAPGLFRDFRIEELRFHDETLLETVQEEAENKIYPSGGYTILASDMDETMITIAEANARRAGVGGDITFQTKSLEDLTHETIATEVTIITNPPYGKRLKDPNLDALYTTLEALIENRHGGYITNVVRNPGRNWKNKKLLNGAEECRFWYH